MSQTHKLVHLSSFPIDSSQMILDSLGSHQSFLENIKVLPWEAVALLVWLWVILDVIEMAQCGLSPAKLSQDFSWNLMAKVALLWRLSFFPGELFTLHNNSKLMTTLELRSSRRGLLPLTVFLFHSKNLGLAIWLGFLPQDPHPQCLPFSPLCFPAGFGKDKWEEPIGFSHVW
jgi:hypothetical protein